MNDTALRPVSPLQLRDEEIAHEVAELAGNCYGRVIPLSCGCELRITERFWHDWNRRYQYQGVMQRECEEHMDAMDRAKAHSRSASQGNLTAEFQEQTTEAS